MVEITPNRSLLSEFVVGVSQMSAVQPVPRDTLLIPFDKAQEIGIFERRFRAYKVDGGIRGDRIRLNFK